MLSRYTANIARNYSLRSKLLFLTLSVISFALLLSAVGLAYNNFQTSKRTLEKSATALSSLVAENVSSALAFNDTEAATAIISSLKFNANVVAAALYDKKGALFASFAKDSTSDEIMDSFQLSELQVESVRKMYTTCPVVVDNQELGNIVLVSSTQGIWDNLYKFAYVSLLVYVIAIILATAVSLKLQKLITNPVTSLLDTMRRISASGDVTIRAEKYGNDEIGSLVDGFNGVLNELEQSAKRVKESEERFEIAVKGAGVGLWDWKIDPHEVYYSDRFKEMLGWDDIGLPEDMDMWAKLIHPDDSDRVMNVMSQHLEQGTPYDVEYRANVNGQFKWFHARGAAIWDESGKPTRMAGSLADITQLVHAEESLRRYFSLSKDIMISVDMNGKIVRANPACTTILGYTESELLQMRILDLTHLEDMEQAELMFSNVQQSSRVDEVEFRLVGKARRTRWISWTSVLMDNGLIFGIGRDVTQKRRAQNELNEYAEQLRRSNLDLENFATVASHDLQEPLRKVQAFRDRLIAKCSDQLDEQGLDYLNRMRDAVDRMKVLISDLLSFSRVGTRAQPFTSVSMDQTAREVLRDLEVLVASSEAEVQLDKLPDIEADPLQMRQLIQNLIGNAIKFRKPGVRPVVVISAKPVADNSNGVLKRDGRLYEFSVADNGIGFEQVYSEKIFKVFQRLHGRSEYEGTGIGLAICKRIVDRHRGNIQAVSVPGDGTKFLFTLPEKQSTEILEDEDAA